MKINLNLLLVSVVDLNEKHSNDDDVLNDYFLSDKTNKII